MEVHLDEGTQRLELPVSRMTLKSWGGVPTLMSEKSGGGVRRTSQAEGKVGEYVHWAFR